MVLGLVKGLTGDDEGGVSLERDLWGPAKEELFYRGAPLWAFPKLPYGSTAVVFAADHVLDDFKNPEADYSATDAAARFGDVLIGGLLYESAFRSHGIVAAIAAHSVHNLAVGLGARLRGKR